ncbi:protein-glutamate O-methyltransferase CheR [Aquabacterium sp. J223]|uniref:CheR family methyltransferase n=1 Tax=Aquabacterium sp. J223 TaxID=2898431 RepID=UPI0021ADB943|nr:protein-glutamate O-methyltransferase CheR [Aquabacterium sp. J223]UUX94544.1 protein-glutamate O-methyltransferase CheR [Aquabacterium sp. J223]
MTPITDAEFQRFQRFIFDRAGITMSEAKKSLVSGRLSKRLAAHGCTSYGAYFEILREGRNAEEVQTAIDLLTTNETYFFREPRHFELLHRLANEAAARGQSMRVWSAASSSGEEAYSIAMVLADRMGDAPWEVVGTDISQRVLHKARSGHYPMERARHIPPAYLKRFCLKGTGTQQGTLLVDKALRRRVRFAQVNLNTTLPQLGSFDLVFLRNVMIYFNGDTKRQVVARVLSLLRPGGHFCIGHAESLGDVSGAVAALAPSIYRKP